MPFMGTQGEIYNILGIKVPVEELDDSALYKVGNKTVWVDAKYYGKADIEDGFGAKSNIIKPELHVKILGVDHELGKLSEDIEALMGYAIANESYIAKATALPKQEEIEKLKPQLVKDIKARFGLNIKLSDLEIFLLYEFAQ